MKPAVQPTERLAKKEISEVIFTTLTEETFKRYAVLIESPYQHNAATKGTPFDKRLGTIESGTLCETCGNDSNGCPGHFGYIELPYPVINPVYLTYVTDMLKCVCYGCSSLLIPEQEQERILAVYESGGTISHSIIKAKCRKTKNCYVCEREKKHEAASIMPPTPEIVRIFKKISNKTMSVLGFNKQTFKPKTDEMFWTDPVLDNMYHTRPESWIFDQILPVVPPHARPYIISDGERKDDELTSAYSNVIKTANHIREIQDQTSQKKKSKKTLEKCISDLEKFVTSIVENKAVAKSASSKDRKINSLSERIKGKEGHMQANIAGKRVDQSARMVIDSSGPWLKANQLGIPRYVAEINTIPQYVTKFNKKFLEEMLRTPVIKCNKCKAVTTTGIEKHIQACSKYLKYPIEEADVSVTYKKGNIASVVRKGNTISVEHATNKYTVPFSVGGEPGLQERDIVYRHIMDGDVCYTNRQPSIREESIQAYEVKIHDDLVLKLPLCGTKAFNADFDGDEMNLHFPQSIGAQAEAHFMMNVAQKIITRQSNSPIVGIVQNTLVSMYMMTRNNTFVETSLALDLFVCADISIDRIHSLAKRCYEIPEYKQYVSVSGHFSPYSTPKIPGKIVASIIFPETFNFYRQTNLDEKFPVFKMEKGVILPDSGPMCKKIVGITKSSCIGALWNRPYSPEVCCNVISELQIIGLHYITRTGFSFGVTDCIPTNDEFIHQTLTDAMVECENINASKKTEFEKEGLINNALNKTMGASATLAKKHMMKGENNSLVIMKVCGAKGTDVNNGQIAGFTGQQNLDGARIKRSLNGTRCLPTFAHNDNSPAARGFVANSLMKGLTPDEAFFYSISGRRGNIDTAIKTADCGYIQKKITKKGEDANQKEDGTIRDASGNIIQFLYGNDGFNAKKLQTIKYKGADIPFFIDVKTLEAHFNNKYELSVGSGVRCQKRNLLDDELDFAAGYVFANAKVSTDSTRASAIMIATVLEDLLRSVTLYEDVIVEFIEEIERVLKSANNATGESVGLIAGCSIGEPATQMTLNTHQFVGVSEKEVMGVTRLKELIGATSNPSNPTMSIFLSPHPEKKFASRIDEMLYKAYSNTIAMLEERGYDVSNHTECPLTKDNVDHFFSVSKPASPGDHVGVIFLQLDLNKDSVEHYIHSKTSDYNHLIVIYLDKITPSAAELITCMKKTTHLEVFNIKEMQYNPLKHVLVPKHEICTEEEKQKLIEVYSIKTLTNFPGISTEDPIVRRIGAVKNQLIKITRKDLVYAHGFEVVYRIVTSETI